MPDDAQTPVVPAPPHPSQGSHPATHDAVALVRALLAEQAPHLASRPLVEVPRGQDNVVVRVGDDLACRVARHALGDALQQVEHRWLAEAAGDLPVPAPVPVVRGVPGAAYPFHWSVVPWARGGTADRTPYDADALAEGLVALLGALHRPAPDDAPDNPYRRVPLVARLPGHHDVVHRVAPDRADALVRSLERAAEVPMPHQRVWVHGDLHPRNLVVADRRLAAAIDWGDLHGGDPAVDLLSCWMLLDERRRQRVREGLALDDGTWERGRGWALVLGALLLRIGRDDGDAAFEAVGERALAEAGRYS